jgi:hypothetical protein
MRNVVVKETKFFEKTWFLTIYFLTSVGLQKCPKLKRWTPKMPKAKVLDSKKRPKLKRWTPKFYLEFEVKVFLKKKL